MLEYVKEPVKINMTIESDMRTYMAYDYLMANLKSKPDLVKQLKPIDLACIFRVLEDNDIKVRLLVQYANVSNLTQIEQLLLQLIDWDRVST